jgi:hypothetical protein
MARTDRVGRPNRRQARALREASRRRPRRPDVEAMEDRTLLSISVSDVSIIEGNPGPITISGTLEPGNETDSVRIRGRAGQRLFIDATSFSSNAGAWNLYDPYSRWVNGTTLGSDFKADLLLDGIYTLLLDGNAAPTATINYSFQIADASDAPVTNTNFGTTFAGNIAAGQVATFNYNASAGTVIHFDSLDQDGDPINVQLRDPNNNVIWSQSASSDAGPIVLSRSGAYTLSVAGNGAGATGDYKFRVLDFAANSTPLTFGALTTGTLPETSTAVFRIDLTPGQRVFYDAIDDDFDQVYARLIGPGDFDIGLGNGFYSDYDSGQINVDVGGTYYLYQYSNVASGTADYSFRLLEASRAPSQAIATGTPTSGTLTPGESTQLYRVALTAGQKLYLDWGALGAGSASWQLYKADGVAFASGSTGGDQFLTAPLTGEYVLALQGSTGNSAPFSYSFRLLDLDADSTALALGTTYSGNLADNQVAVYRVAGTAGSRLLYDAIDVDYDGVSALLYRPDGNLIGIFSNASYDTNPFYLDRTGTHYLVLRADSGTPDFGFRLLDTAAAPAVPLGAEQSATLNPGRSVDLYRVNLTAGQRLYVDFTAAASTAASWYLHRPDSTTYIAGTTIGFDAAAVAPIDGTYVLAVYGDSASTLDYKFRVLDIGAAASSLTLGATTSGTLAGRSAVLYSFAGTAGQRLMYDAHDRDNDAVNAVLYNPSGGIEGINGNADSDTNPFVLGQTGTYTLAINSTVATGNPDFQFRLLDAGAAPLVTPGTPRSGTLTPGSATDLYRISGTAGQRLYLDMRNASSSNGSWYLYRPDNAGTVTGNSFTLDGIVTLPVDGTYVLALFGGQAADIAYSFQVDDLATAPAALAFGAEAAQNLPAYGSALYAFNGTAGQRLFYDAIEDDTENVRFQLYDPDSGLFQNLSYNDSDPFTLTKTGRYVVVMTNGTNAAADFRFRLIDTAAAPAEPLALNTPIANTLNPGRQTAVYRFNGSAGQSIYVDFTSGTGGNWYLYRPDNVYMGGSSLGSDGEFDLTQTGEHILVVLGNSMAATPYAFGVNGFTQASTPLTLGTVVDSTIAVPGERDVYTFDAVAGQRLYFDGQAGPADGSISAYLYTPEEGIVGVNTSIVSDSVPFTIVRPGTYRLVLDGNGSTTGGYRFLLSDIAAAPTQPVTLGTNYAGTLTPGRATQLYTIAGTAGQSLAINTTGTGGTWRLFSPANDQLGGTILPNDQTIFLTETGTYVLAVQGTFATPVNYTVQVDSVVPAATALSGWNATQSGSLAAGAFADFTFTAPAGRLVYFDTLDRDNDSAVVTLRDPDNQVVFLGGNNASSDYGPYQLLKSGTYTLRVSNGSAVSAADYKFRFLDLATAATAYTLGADTAGDLPEYEADVFAFDGTAGTRLAYDGIDADFDGVNARLYRGTSIVGVNQNADSDTNPFFLDTTAPYYLIVSNDSVAATPDYRFALIDLGAAPTAVLPLDGTTVAGTLDPGRSRDTFRFDGAAGQLLYFDFGNTTTGATWRLFGPNNQAIGSFGPSGDTMVRLPVAGAYSLIIDGSSATTQPYSFRVLQPAAGTALAFGTTYTDTVAAQSTKLYTFTGAVGQRLLYDALDNDFDSTIVTLFDPDGNVAHLGSGNSDSDVYPFTLTKAGTYTLAQRVTDGTARDHSFRLIDAGQAPAQVLVPGPTPINVTIDPGREVEVFRFNGTAGQVIYLDMLGGSGNVSWTLYRPNNGGESSGGISSDVFDVLGATGEYLLVFGGSSPTPVSFDFRMLDLAADATPLAIGTLATGTLPGSSATVFRFNGTAGQVLLYDGQDTDADAVNFTIYRADGTYVTGTNADYDTDPFRLPVTGGYYLVMSSTAAGTPDYAFRLLDAAASPSAPIALDAPVSGTLNPGNGAQIYTFSGVAGQRLYVDFTSASTSAATWYLYNPSLNYLTSGYFGNDREVALTQSGTYTLVLFGGNSVATPTPYSFAIYDANTTTTAYALGTLQAGSLDEPGERDQYTFAGAVGQRLYFDGLGDSGASNEAYAQVFDPEGTAVLSSWLDNDGGPVTLTKAGTYTIRVFEYYANGTATSYSFRLADVAQPPTVALTEGTVYTGSLDPGRSTQLFRFDATAGERFYFDSLMTGFEGDGYWYLFGPDNNYLTANYGSNDHSAVLPATGTYVLAYQGSDASGTVPYNFRAYFSSETSTPLTLGATTLGTIAEPGERDAYTFAGYAGQQLFFDGLTGQSGGQMSAYLYDADGTYLVGVSLPNDGGPITLDHAGTFRLVVEGGSGVTGPYSFRMLDLSAQPYQSLDTTIAEVTVTLAAPSASPVTVSYATADGTASAVANDYTAASGTLTFAPGETSKVVQVVITRDLGPEPNETVFVNLSNPVGATITDAQGVITILNDDGPSIFVDNPQVVEGNAGTVNLVFTVTLSSPASFFGAAVSYATADGTATAGSDYLAASGTLTFNTGETTKTVTITVNGDSLAEADETVFLNLSNAVSAVILDAQGVGTIRNDDTAIVASTPSVSEGNSGTTALVFTVTLTQPVVQAVTVNYATANGTATAGSDYVATSGTLSFAPGETTKTVSVTVNGDTTLEPNETVLLNLSGAVGGSILTPQAVGTILNDDSELAIGDAAIVEGNSGTRTLAFTVTLSPASGSAASVNWATASGTATAGSDFAAAGGTLNFAPGETTKTVNVTINGDATPEAFEAFSVVLSGAANATIGDGTGIGTIQNDDAAFAVDDAQVLEGPSGTTPVVVAVRLLFPVVTTVTVQAATADGSATAPSDYAALAPTTVTFAPGETSKSVTVNVVGDGTPEPNEAFFVDLSGPSAGVLDDGQAIVTIRNDDTTVSIADAAVTEGNGGTTTMTFVVSLSVPSAVAVSLNYTTADNSATVANGDYVATSGTLTFGAGETSKSIAVVVNGDTTAEAYETLLVNLSAATNAVLVDAQAIGTIRNDDAALVIDSRSIVEGNSGTTPFVFTVGFVYPVAQSVTVNVATADGTAGAPADYAAIGTGTTLTFSPGETARLVTVDVVGDTLAEGDETFTVNLSGATGATIATATGVGTIRNDDTTVSVAGASVTEGNAGTVTVLFPVSLGVPTAQAVTVEYFTANGTAVAPGDYATAVGTVTFAPGETARTVAVTVTGDLIDEFDETFTLNLTNAVNAVLGTAVATGTITDDDAPVSAAIADASVAEGNAGTTPLAFTVTLSAASGKTVTVDWSTAAGSATAGADYSSASGTLTFAPGETTKTVSVNVLGDTVDEPDETFVVNLANVANATLADAQAIGTILDDDAGAGLSIADASVAEGNAGTVALVFTVTLGAPSGQAVAVDWGTAAGTATAGVDYATANGTVTFAPGETTKTVSVTVNGDTLDEFDETILIHLSGPVNAIISDAQATGTILDDDAAVSVALGDASVTEGNSGTVTATFTVSLTAPSGKPISVDWGTANGTATAGADYVVAGGTLSFAPGELSKTISVTVNGDALDEFDETFLVNLSNAANAGLIDAQGVGTIVDDDAPAAISVANASVTEGSTGTATLVFTVSLGTASGKPVSIDWGTADGTAVAPADFTAASGTLSFAPGETTKTVSVTVVGDALDEFDETFALNLSNATNATIGTATATGTILDDDAAVSAGIADVSVAEGNAATLTVTLSGPSGKPVSIDWGTASGTAVAPGDYAAASGTLTFAPGETTKTVSVNTVADSVDEPDETFVVNLANVANATLADAQAIGTILDDDAPAAVSVANAGVTEGNAGTATLVFTVSLGAVSGKAITVDWGTANGTAVAPGDYVAAGGTLSFAPGETSKTVSVTVNGDALDEFDESFSLNLTNPSNATIGAGVATGTILDDDAEVSASVGDVGVVEGNSGTVTATFTVSLTGPSGKPVAVNWGTADGTAVAPGDYVAAGGTLTFAPGEVSKTVSVTVVGDTLVEGNETYFLNLTGPANATLADAQAVGTIVDDDTVSNRPPTAVNDEASATDQAPVTVNVLANDTDPDLPNDTLTVIAVGTLPAGAGTLSYNGTSVTYTPTPNTHGPVTFSYTIRDAAGLQSTANVVVNVTDVTRPSVVDLRAVAGGRAISILNTTRTLPWVNVRGLEVVFSEDVGVDQADMVLTGVNQASYPFGSMSYDGPGRTARWNLPTAVGVDRLLMTLDGDAATGGVADRAGNGLLGGDFLRTLRVVPGDYDGDGAVSIFDVVGVRGHMPQFGGAYSLWADLDADGDVDNDDINHARARLGRQLP